MPLGNFVLGILVSVVLELILNLEELSKGDILVGKWVRGAERIELLDWLLDRNALAERVVDKVRIEMIKQPKRLQTVGTERIFSY